MIMLAPLAALTLLAGCAGQTGDDTAGGAADGGTDGDAAAGGDTRLADDDLLIRIDRGEGTPQEEHTLNCVGEPEGTLPDPAEACAYLASLENLFEPVPEDAVCTEIYGGPQTATIIGRWNGEPVDLELSRINGCKIAQWDRLEPILPGELDPSLEPAPITPS